MLILAFLSTSILPYMLMLGQASSSSRGIYTQSTRSLLLNNALNELEPERPTFYTNYHNSSMNTSYTESGSTIPFRETVSTSTADCMKRTTYFYIYKTSTDATNAARILTAIPLSSEQMFINAGNSSSVMDQAGRTWYGDGNLYDSTKRQPGYDSAGTSGTTESYPAYDIVNTSNDSVYYDDKKGTGGANLDWSFDVTNGYYVVKLYFAELDTSVTSSNRRLNDIYIEGKQMNVLSLGTYERLGGNKRAYVASYDVYVSDSLLNVSIRKNSSSALDAHLSGISIKRRRML